MKTIAYSNPFVPPEWIAAHDLRPSWLRLRESERPPLVGAIRGVCPYAGALADSVLSRLNVQCATASTEAVPRSGGETIASVETVAHSLFAADAVVLATSCDQMRFVAALLERQSELPLFLMNVPSTWQTAAARDLYRDELVRLGRFLVRLGGEPPSPDRLARVMLDYDAARARLRAAQGSLTARQMAEALAEVRCGVPRLACPTVPSALLDKPAVAHRHTGAFVAGTALALLGGPLLEKDYAILDLVERAGGRVVLDATEGGLRTLPAAFDPRRVGQEPLEELADAYFRAIPDIFRRPNDGLYRWLAEQLTACQVRGILLRRYVWCDLWHAELQRLREWSPVPVLEIDLNYHDRSALARTLGRVEAFLETLP